ncbi:MAG: histidine kinase dimerization/phospho-acceptor domain-containing protein, partial [Chitinispirillia bacterium]
MKKFPLLRMVKIFLNYFNQNKFNEKEYIDKIELEKLYETSLNDLKKANSLKSNFLSTVSHEIRTPLNAIMGVAEVLGETPLDEEQEEYVSMLQKAGDNLLILINDILDFSKIEAGEMVLEESSFHLADLVDETISLLSVKAHENNINLQYELDQNLPLNIYGDSYRLKQILVNLVGNAIKFTPGGNIFVSVSDIS